ncbi:hypothetical protein QQ045_019901 [Rhodiola kirilowii]
MNTEGMKINESFQVATVIEKRPSGWKDFKNYLKHKRKEMSTEDLVICLQNEEDNRLSDKRIRLPSGYKDFKNYLKQKRKEMSMEDLVIRLKNERIIDSLIKE